MSQRVRPDVSFEYPVVHHLTIEAIEVGHPLGCKGPTEQPRRMADTMLLSLE